MSSVDNDLFGSRTRTNVFGQTGVGIVEDVRGIQWHYSWNIRLQIDRDDDFFDPTERTSNFTLVQIDQ